MTGAHSNIPASGWVPTHYTAASFLTDQPLYDSEYTIDSNGSVRHKGAELKPVVNSHGFHFYTIYLRNGKQKSILPHIEVYKRFKGEYPFGGIKHLDGNKLNNRYDNLVPCHPAHKYVEYIQAGISISKVAAYYKTTKKEISKYVKLESKQSIRQLRHLYPLNKDKDI